VTADSRLNAVKSHRDLIVWQRSMTLAIIVYRLSGAFPQSEAYGLRAQIHRAAVSVPSNIAEGHARRSRRDFTRFISISLGSLAEVDTQLILATELGYCDRDSVAEAFALIEECQKMLHGLLRALSPLTPNP
jgi:four helix bundle protein